MAVSPSGSAGVIATLRAAGCVFAQDEARLLLAEARTAAHLEGMVEQRAAGVPLEHVLGWAEFRGLRIAVDPGVFVPRRRSELLVRRAVALAQPRPVVVDLCCGSGAVGAAVVAALNETELHAVDIDPAAVRCARRNLADVGGHVYEGNLYEPLPGALRGRVDVLVVNAPYVPTNEIELMPAEARLHEPLVALDGGGDGLDVHRRIAAGASRWLSPDGHLLVEVSDRQAERLAETFAASGLRPDIVTSSDLDGTVVTGTRGSA